MIVIKLITALMQLLSSIMKRGVVCPSTRETKSASKIWFPGLENGDFKRTQKLVPIELGEALGTILTCSYPQVVVLHL